MSDIKKINETEELWIYNSDLRWNGYIFFPFFPIALPMAIPVGFNKIEFTIKDNRIVNASTTGTGKRLSYCHLGLTIEGTWEAFCRNDKKQVNKLPDAFIERDRGFLINCNLQNTKQ